MGSGTYTGKYQGIDSIGKLLVKPLPGEEIMGTYSEEEYPADFSMPSHPRLCADIMEVLATLETDDVIEVDVEFNNYTVEAVRSRDFSPRALHLRLTKVEEALRGLGLLA